MAKFALSSKGLLNASAMPLEDDFSFVIGSKRYKCNRFFAGFISPTVAMMIKGDPSVSELILTVDDPNGLFMNIIQLMNGMEISITPENSEFLLNCASQLGNRELISQLSGSTKAELTLDNCLSTITILFNLELDITAVASYIAAHITELPEIQIQALNPDVLRRILLDSSLRIDSESWLFNFVVNTINEKGEKYKVLLDTVSFLYLSQKEITNYLSLITLDDVDHVVWHSICERLTSSTVITNDSQSKRFKRNWTTIPYNEADQMHGIIRYLSEKHGTNKLIKQGIVKLKASSYPEQTEKVIDQSNATRWQSADEQNSWWMIDFCSKQVRLTTYSIKTYKVEAGPDGWHMKSWEILASNDEVNWTKLDTKTDSTALNGAYKIGSFNIDNNEFYQYYKIQMVGRNHAGNYAMTLGGFEIYGDILENEKK